MQEYNNVGDAGAIDLAHGLSTNSCLQYLFLVRYEPLLHIHLSSTLLHLPWFCVDSIVPMLHLCGR